MIEPDPSGYFITGSDTDVGKTYIACEIVSQLRARGLAVETRKPAESGCEADANGESRTQDALALRQANADLETIERIAPYRFRAALAPHRAARLERVELRLAQLIDACGRDRPDACLVVEGAGGFYSPLAVDGLNADLASALQLPVIAVIDDRIGAVNQSLMTIAAIASRGLRIAAIVLNQVSPGTDAEMDNAADLAVYSDLPLLRCAHGARLPAMFT
ncbi:MAG TPA: dethiobiotin synthase [Gammaproteobacteria bacterium]|nr:dethiobiotin synthase [Gammaproteobacteria bacterium]